MSGNLISTIYPELNVCHMWHGQIWRQQRKKITKSESSCLKKWLLWFNWFKRPSSSRVSKQICVQRATAVRSGGGRSWRHHVGSVRPLLHRSSSATPPGLKIRYIRIAYHSWLRSGNSEACKLQDGTRTWWLYMYYSKKGSIVLMYSMTRWIAAE